jgi:hypothetical protein
MTSGQRTALKRKPGGTGLGKDEADGLAEIAEEGNEAVRVGTRQSRKLKNGLDAAQLGGVWILRVRLRMILVLRDSTLCRECNLNWCSHSDHSRYFRIKAKRQNQEI